MIAKESPQTRLTAIVTPLLDAAGASGASVALLVDGDTVGTEGIGFRDLARTTRLDADARFYLYSVTKTLLAVAALRLVERGLLALDGPIQSALPEMALDQPVTLRQVLNHCGGVPDYSAMPEYFAAVRAHPGVPWTGEALLARTLSRGALFPPGTSWAYSNIGYLLIRREIERVGGRSLREVLTDEIFAPLDLRRILVAESLVDAHVLTPGFDLGLDEDGELHDISQRYHPGWVSHGVVISSASEVARLLDGLFSGRLLGSAMRSEMIQAVPVPVAHPLIRKPGYGLGLMMDLASPYGLVAGHGGGGPGYSTAAFQFENVSGHRLTCVALANRDCADLGLRIAFAIAAWYAQEGR